MKDAPNINQPMLDSTIKKTVEEVINKWSKEMEKSSSKFHENGEKLKEFEATFQKNFENVSYFL